MTADDAALADVVSRWLPSQRWFAGKDSSIGSAWIASRTPLPGGAAHVVVGVALRDGTEQMYQVPILALDVPDRATLIGSIGDVHVHDGLAYEQVLAAILDCPTQAPLDPDRSTAALQSGWLSGRSEGGDFRALSGEQSNTNVIHGQDLIKFYRQLVPGVNPDVELRAGLTTAGSTSVDPLVGWINAGWTAGGQAVHGHAAIITRYLTGAREAFDLAVEAVSEQRSFAQQARALGETTAHLHADLAAVFGTGSVETGTILEQVHGRLDEAVAQIPELQPYAQHLHAQIAQPAASGTVAVQRVHGDLHLSQFLWHEDQWQVIDFEGEPGAETARRRRPDNRLRDVAGVLRSLDYAAHTADAGSRDQWRIGAESAFLSAYCGPDGYDTRLLQVYLIDKASYEALYEKRNRPHLLHIPVEALERLSGA